MNFYSILLLLLGTVSFQSNLSPKLYWSDRSSGEIQSANLDGSNNEVFIDGLSIPMGIALDVPSGYIYWAELGNGKIFSILDQFCPR